MARRTMAQIEADMLERISRPIMVMDRKGHRCTACNAEKPAFDSGWRSPERGKFVCPSCWPGWCAAQRFEARPRWPARG